MAINPWSVNVSEGWDVPTSPPVEDENRQFRDRIMEELARMGRYTMPDADPDDDYEDEHDEYNPYEDEDDNGEDEESDQVENTSQRFMRNGAIKCPCCESTNISALGVKQPFNAMIVRVNNLCRSCEATWVTAYRLIGIEDIDEPGGMDEDAMKRLGIS